MGCRQRQQGPRETPLQPHQPWAEAGPSSRGRRGPHPRACSRHPQGQRAAYRPREVSAGQESGPHLINRLSRGHRLGTQAAVSVGERSRGERRGGRPVSLTATGWAQWRLQMRGQARQASSGAWAPAGRCSTADNGASPRASHPTEPQRPPRGCLLAPSPQGAGRPSACQSGFWTQVTPAAPGPQDGPRLVIRMRARPAELRHFCPSRRRQAMSKHCRG